MIKFVQNSSLLRFDAPEWYSNARNSINEDNNHKVEFNDCKNYCEVPNETMLSRRSKKRKDNGEDHKVSKKDSNTKQNACSEHNYWVKPKKVALTTNPKD